MDEMKEKSNLSDGSQLLDELDEQRNNNSPEGRKQKSKNSKDKQFGRHFSSKESSVRFPIISKLVAEQMLLYWRENYHASFEKRGRWVHSTELLEKEEMLEQYGVFSEGLKRTSHLEKLNLSGGDIPAYLLMEIAEALTINRSLKELDLSGSRLSSFGLSYLFSKLAKNKSVSILKLSNNSRLDFEAVQDLVELLLSKESRLKSIDFSDCNIPDNALALLCNAFGLANGLQSLNLSLIHFSSSSLLALSSGIANTRSLIQLDISYSDISSAALRLITENLPFFGVHSIQNLNLAGNRIASDKELMRFLDKMKSLKELDLSYNNLSSIATIFPPRLDKTLEVLKLRGNQIEEIPEEMLSNLKSLDLSNNRLYFKGANKIAKKLRQVPNPKWTHLKLDHNYIESEGFNDIIYALRDNQTLQSLSIAYNQLDGETVLCLIVNYDALYLQTLDITGNQIHYSIVFVFLKQMKQCRLRKLSFCDLDNDTKGEGQHECKFALNCEDLQELDFSGNQYISCAVVYSLQTRLNNIQTLNLRGCTPFHDQDLINLAAYIKKSQCLRQLNLRNLNLGTLLLSSIEELAAVLRQNNKLQQLDLSSNKLSHNDTTLEILLPSLGKCSNLETLDLSLNRITQKNRYPLQRLLIKSKSLKKLSLAYNLITLESLLSLDLEDQWELFFKSSNLQKLRKQSLAVTARTGNNNNNNLGFQKSSLFLQPSSMNVAFPNIVDEKKEEGNNNITTLQTRREEEVFIRKLEDRKREFLREHRKAFRRSLGEGSGCSLMRLKLQQLDGSGMKLRSEDLGVLGQLLSEGEVIKELDLSSNLLFGKSNKVAESLLCGEPLQSLTLQHQRFHACDNFASIFFTHSSLSSQTSYHSKSTGYSTAQTLPPTYSPANQNKSIFQAHSQNTNTNSASFFQGKANQSQFAANQGGSSISQQTGLQGLQHGYSQIIYQPTITQQQSQSQQAQLAGSFGQIPSTSTQQTPVQTIKFHTSKTIQVSQINQYKQSQIQIANATSNSTKNKKSVEQILLRGCVFDQISFENLLFSFKTLLNAASLKVFEAENIVVPVFYLADMLCILKNCANLEILKLRKLMFDDSFCVQLEQLLTTTTSLKLLDLSRNSFDDNQLSLLVQGLKNNRTLHNVVMEKLKVKQSFFPPFFDALASLQTLKLLDLAHNALSSEVFQALAVLLSSSKKLKFVNIAYHRSFEQEQATVKKNLLKKNKTNKKGQLDNQDDDDEDEEEEEEYIFENNQNKVQIGGITQIEEQVGLNQEDLEQKSINDSQKVVELTNQQGDEQIYRQQGLIKGIDTEKLALNIDLEGIQPRFNIFNNENNTLNVKEDTSQKQSTDQQNNTQIKKKKNNNLLGTPIRKVKRKKSYDTKDDSRKRDIISQNLHQIRERVYFQHWIEMESFIVLCDRIKNPNSLRHLDLSGCGISHNHFEVLVDALCQPDCQLKSLNLPSNKILDTSNQQLYNLIANNNCLQELNLAFCSLTPLAYKAIAAGLAKGKGLRCLDVSDNEGGDAFCEAICLGQRQIIYDSAGSLEKDKEARGKLQFLFVSGMKIGAVGNRYLKEVLKNANRLFISNDWEEVDDELAEQILSSYQEVFARHNFIPHMIPSYLKRLSITNSEISDAFCSRLARRFYEFEFLEVIDLSNNRCMTSIGKISLFLHLFDIRFDNSKLKAFTINIDQERDLNIKKSSQLKNKNGFNDTNPAMNDGNRNQGIVSNQDPNQIINKESPKQPQQKDSAFSKWKSFYSLSLVDTGVLCSVVSALPTDLSFFQKIVAGAMSSKKLLPPKFQLNQTLYAKLERRQAPWTATVGLIIHFFVWIVQWCLPPLYLLEVVDIYEDGLHRIIVGVIALLSFLLTTYELIAVCSDRRRSNLLLQNEELYQKYWRSWMNKREISLCFISFMERFDGITDAVISGLFYQTGHDSLTVFTLVFIGLKSLRRLWNAFLYSFKMKSISGKEEVSGFMQVCWKLLLTQGFYAADNYINKFSPSDSVRVLFSRVYINLKSAFHLYMLGFEVLISLILNIIYLAYADPNRDKTTAAESIALYSVGKHFIQFLFHLFVFLLFKPSQIGQNHFDEAIIALRYRKALERFDRDQPQHRPPTLLSAAASRPSNFTNFRSLLNPSSFRYDFGTKNKHLDQIPANHPYHPGAHEDNHNAGTDEETFQEKYFDGLLKKNKHTFSTSKRGRRESSSDEDEDDNDGSQDHLKCKEEEGLRREESISVASIIEDNGPSVRLPHSIFNEPKFINNLYVLNQVHSKAASP